MNNQSGFTLIELLVVIAIAAVLLGLGVPSFRDTIQSNRVATISNDLIGALQFARSEAIRRGEDVTVCATSDQSTCSAGWVDGWLVRNAAGPIRVWPSVRQGATIVVGGTVVFNALGSVTTTRCFQVNLGSFQRSVTAGAGGRIGSAVAACS